MRDLPFLLALFLAACNAQPVRQTGYAWFECITFYENSAQVRQCQTAF
jgi:hypothetical protein